MTYHDKQVYTPDDFRYSEARIGDYVSQEVVDDAMNCLPPACMTSACAQMGEPYSTRLDPETETYRNTYATFRRVTGNRDGIWQYCGHCFHGETVERGTEPPYISLGK